MAIADVAPIAAALLGLAACTYPSLPPPRCDPMGSYSAPQPLAWEQQPPGQVGSVRLSDDELTVYFDDRHDLYVASRPTVRDRFGPLMTLDTVNTSAVDVDSQLSHDGLTLWLASDRMQPSTGRKLLYIAKRSSVMLPFEMPAPFPGVINDPTPGVDSWQPFVSADGTELWFSSDRERPPGVTGMGGYDLWRARGTGGEFSSAPEFVDTLSSPSYEYWPMLSPDGLTLFFSSSNAPGSDTAFRLYRAHRDTRDAPFQLPNAVQGFAGVLRTFATWMSPDQCRLYGTYAPGNGEVLVGFVATQQPSDSAALR